MALFNEPTATREELEAYIGSAAKTPYYKKVLDTYMENPNKPIWCWPAFLISFFWFWYRKATIPTILLILVYLALYAYALVSLPLFIGLLLLVSVMVGLFGINIYLSNAEKEIARIKEHFSGLGDKRKIEAIKKRGGASSKYPVVLYVFIAIIYLAFIFTHK